MRNAGLDEAQAGIKIARRNINNLRCADDTTLMAESEEELKSLLMKVKEEGEKVGLKLNIQKTKIMASGPTTSWEIDRETVETVADFIFLGSKITADGDCSQEIKRCLLLGRKVTTNPLQYSCLENPRDRGAWWAAVYGVAQSRTRLKRLSSSSSRQRIKKQRHYFANKGPSSQGYGFSSGHVWMWVLDYKKSWAPKNWCFWIVVLEKTLESPLAARRSNQSILKEISPDYSLEGLMLKLKLHTPATLVWMFSGLAGSYFLASQKICLILRCGVHGGESAATSLIGSPRNIYWALWHAGTG